MKRRRWTRIVGAGAGLLGVYLIALVALAPASFAWRVVEPHLELPVALEIGSLSGFLWNGRAQALRVNGRQAGALAWRWQPAALVHGRLGLQIDWHLGGDRIVGQLRLGPSAGEATAVRGVLAASRVQGWFELPLLLEGQLDLDIARIAWDEDTGIHSAAGAVFWANAAAGLPRPVPLGQYRGGLESMDGALRLRVESSPESMLAVQGLAGWAPPATHHVDFLLRARTEAEAALRPALDMLAQPQSDGSYRLRLDSTPTNASAR
jgi:general secretion pathway protein N